MPIKQENVLDQYSNSGGNENDESCGYHVLKNALLSLMLQKNFITEVQFKEAVNKVTLFKTLFNQTKKLWPNGDYDLSLPIFLERLQQIQEGSIDIGIPQSLLYRLHLIPDGTENLSVVNVLTSTSNYGLTGMENDLYVSSAIVHLALNKGACKHVFAVGLNNEHWVTVALEQKANGTRHWTFMDSWKNQTNFMHPVIAMLEGILGKNRVELRQYLLEAYENTNTTFNRHFNTYFDANGLRLGNFPHIQEIFIDKTMDCGMLSMTINPEACDFAEVDALAQANNGVKVSIIKYGLKLFFADHQNKVVHPIELFGNSQDLEKLNPLFTADHTLANVESLRLLQAVVIPDAKKFFLAPGNLNDYTTSIVNRYRFMENNGWLSHACAREREHIDKLHTLCDFILHHLNGSDFRTRFVLEPILSQLRHSLTLTNPSPLDAEPENLNITNVCRFFTPNPLRPLVDLCDKKMQTSQPS